MAINNTVNIYVRMIPTVYIPLYFIYVRTPLFRLLRGRNCQLDVRMVSKQFKHNGKNHLWIYWIKARLT